MVCLPLLAGRSFSPALWRTSASRGGSSQGYGAHRDEIIHLLFEHGESQLMGAVGFGG